MYVCKLMSLNVANEEATELTSEQVNFLRTKFSVFLCQAKPKLPYLAIYGHLAIGPWATNSGKWGIPEKSYKNVALQ